MLKRSLLALCLLAVSLALLKVSVAVAAGDEIRVITNESLVRFPSDLIFNLEVEGDQEIVEIKLYYRTAPNGIWTYTYPEFRPSNHLEASLDIMTSGLNYLPPGAEIEYYYSIRDTNGNTFDTDLERFVFIDSKFEWQTAQAGPLTIYWHGLAADRVQQVAASVETSLTDIADLLDVGLETPIRGVIYNSRSEAAEALPFQSRTTAEGQVFQGFAFTEMRTFVGLGLDSRLIVHESAHLLLGDATGSPGARVPAWVNEGFATHVEPGAPDYRRLFPSGVPRDLMPLRHMFSIPGTAGDIRNFYRKAESVVGYLIDSEGPERFKSFVDTLDQGISADPALRTNYGFGLDALDRRWQSDLSQVPQGFARDNGAPFASSTGTFIIGALALALLAVVTITLVGRRIRRMAAGAYGDDGLTDEEWEERP